MHMWPGIGKETRGVNIRREHREGVWGGGYVTGHDILE